LGTKVLDCVVACAITFRLLERCGGKAIEIPNTR
jgi:hypothetical protein